jgi:hypothetical protein
LKSQYFEVSIMENGIYLIERIKTYHHPETGKQLSSDIGERDIVLVSYCGHYIDFLGTDENAYGKDFWEFWKPVKLLNLYDI